MKFTNLRKAIIVIGLIIALASLLLPANAFTETTVKYYTVKAFPNQQCKERMLAGIEDAYNPQKWAENQDLLPANAECIGKDQNCSARYYAEQYKQKAINQTSTCESAYLKGTMAYFYLNSYNPVNWQHTMQGCKDLFNIKIEETITERKTQFNIREDCPTDENQQIAIGYGSEDQNNAIQNLTGYWERALEPKQEEKMAAEATATKMYQLIQEDLGEEPTEKQIQIATELVLEMEKYDCLLAKEDEWQLYQQWKTLNQVEKDCLPIFLSSKETNYWEFVNQCPHFQANTTDFMQFSFAAGYAHFALTKYFEAGFAERRCQNMQQGQVQLQGQQQTTGYPICYFTPKNLLGCIKEFKHKDQEAANVWEDAETSTILWLIAGGAFIWIIFIMRAQKTP